MKRSLIILALLLGCAARSQTSNTQPNIVIRASVIAAGDRMAAIRLLEDELNSGRHDPAVEPWAMLWAGEQRRLSNDLPQARAWLEQLAQRYPTHLLKDPAILGMAMVDATQALSGNTLATLQLMGESNVPPTMNADRFRILAEVGEKEGTPMPKVRRLAQKSIAAAASDPAVLARVKASLSHLLVDPQVTPAMAQPTGTAEEIALARARNALKTGDFEAAVTQAAGAVQTWPASAHLLELEYIQRRAAKNNPTVAGKVGVLLPASGDYGPAAAQLRQVVQLANVEAGSPIELVFGDTLGTTEGTAAEIERLVIDEGCVAILGPLLKQNGDEAARRAQALRTPLLTFTQGGDPTSAGSFAFRGFMTLSHQVEALLNHSFEQEGHQRYAVLHPENGYGERAADLFTASVTKRGGTITQIVSYSTDTTDFRATAQEITGKNIVGREQELQALKREAKRRGEDPKRVMLPPVFEYEAIFIPDNHRRLVLVSSALAYEELPVGSFKQHEDETPVQLLGLNAWNNPQLVSHGGRYVQNSAFVDAFWVYTDDDTIKDFNAVFEGTVERSPRVIDALTWDATRLITAAVLQGGDDREAIRSAMSEVEIDDPVAGGKRLNEDREVDRQFHVLTIGKQGITLWTPPPPTEEEPINPAQ
jgi:ABC-type branched-subunit amino acid transport system substrate-binding protein